MQDDQPFNSMAEGSAGEGMLPQGLRALPFALAGGLRVGGHCLWMLGTFGGSQGGGEPSAHLHKPSLQRLNAGPFGDSV